MVINTDRSLSATDIRHRAEEQLEMNAPATDLGIGDESARLVHELQVHQIELEMQNQQLLQTRSEVEALLGKYTDLYDFAPVGYFTLDRSGVIRTANLRGANLLSMERATLPGRRFGLFVAPEARSRFTAFLGEVFAGQDMESCEVTLVNKGNSPVMVQIEALAEKSGQECRVAVIDITERRHAQDELDGKRREMEELNRTLRERIGRAVDDLREKDQMLIVQERLVLMGEMIDNIAHQWRQPLNTLGLVIQQLPLFHGSAAFSREFLQENVDQAMELIQHMSRTIDDFRNFFRSDKEADNFNVNEVIRQTLSIIEKSFMNQQIQIASHAEGTPVAYGYPNEYSQVLLNILMNARDALIDHKVADARIILSAFTEGEKTVVTISDNAGGIAEEIIDRLFEPYFTTKGPDKGTGIGLFMSKTIIEKNMGGSLTVRNTGSGAEFRIEV
jgi:signal transduction histidine kinase